MAMACFRLVTFPPFPPLPERRVPFFSLRIALATLLLAAWPYFLADFLREDDLFLVGIRPSGGGVVLSGYIKLGPTFWRISTVMLRATRPVAARSKRLNVEWKSRDRPPETGSGRNICKRVNAFFPTNLIRSSPSCIWNQMQINVTVKSKPNWFRCLPDCSCK